MDVHVVALERVHERFREAVALGAIRRRRDRQQAQLVGVEDRGRRRVLRAVVRKPLDRVPMVEAMATLVLADHALMQQAIAGG